MSRDVDSSLAIIGEERPHDQIDTCQRLSEQTLAHAGAQYAMLLHTKKQGREFGEALRGHLAFMSIVAEDRTNDLVASGASESQVSQGVISLLTESKKSVLQSDADYRLQNSRFERAKEWVAGNELTRWAGQLVPIAVYGGLAYFAFKGIETKSKKHNLLIIGSALGAQTAFRSLGHRLGDHSSRQLDEYVPHNGPEELEGGAQQEQLKRHVDHISAAENDLHKIATSHFSENPGDYKGLTPLLIDGLGKWYSEYYRQPTLKDRTETLIIGSLAVAFASITVASS